MKYVTFLLKLVLFLSTLFFIYFFSGFKRNEYLGYKQISFDGYTLVGVLVLLIQYTLVFRKPLNKPSDFFVLFYSLIVIYPYTVLHGIWGRSGFDYLSDLFLLYVPFLLVITIRTIKIRFPQKYISREKASIYFLIFFVICICTYLVINSPSSASFSLINSYVRRLEARELYGAGTLVSYASAMAMNTMLSFIAYYGVVRKKIVFITIPIFFYLVFYYIYGVKAPLFYIFLSYLLGVFVTFHNIKSFTRFLFTGFIVLVLLASLELLITGYSYFEDYIIRRVFFVISYLNGAYFELFNSADFPVWTGLPEIKSASMHVGEVYLGRPGLNANTNTFLYFLIQKGIVGYVLISILVGLIFSFFDVLSRTNPLFIFLAFIYALLILEQSATTALVSSGISLVVALFFFSSPKQDRELK